MNGQEIQMTDTPPLKPTICVDCIHYEKRGDHWYLTICNAAPRDKKLDYVSGEYVESEPVYCRDLNDRGVCPLFEQLVEESGWLRRQLQQSVRNVAKWPQWQKDLREAEKRHAARHMRAD